jgi:hypothetical protein
MARDTLHTFVCDTLIYVKAQKRNLTVALPAELIRDAKVLAAKRSMSLNAWIYESLDRAVRFGDNHIAAGERILEASEKGVLKMPKRKWKRSELYDL